MAFDAFLKTTTIPGESEDSKHQNWIEILSYNHAVSQPMSGSVSSGGSRTVERCDHADFTITKKLDSATPKLALSCCDGTHIKEVTLELCRSGGDKLKYMEYKMSDVIVRAVTPSGVSNGDLPVEQVSFAYGKIEWTYTETDHKTGAKKGDIKGGWDLHQNKAV
jgi:type VI secretion system secreted protein Hcp